jgi:hypothetical protein
MVKAIEEIKDVEKAIEDVHGDRAIPHRIFEVYPRAESRLLGLSLVRTVSRWAFDELRAEAERRKKDTARHLY